MPRAISIMPTRPGSRRSTAGSDRQRQDPNVIRIGRVVNHGEFVAAVHVRITEHCSAPHQLAHFSDASVKRKCTPGTRVSSAFLEPSSRCKCSASSQDMALRERAAHVVEERMYAWAAGSNYGKDCSGT